MNREEKRELEKSKNIFKEFLKVLKHYAPEFIEKLNGIADPRHQSYITYKVKSILLQRLFAYIMGIESMQEITKKFNKKECIENLKMISNDYEIRELAHHDTINDLLEKIEITELEKIRKYLILKFTSV